MKRPSFQFYPGDWLSNGNLRRCTDAEQGVWVRVLCVLHDQDEYGLVRWTLKELAQAACTTTSILKSLVKKGVLKGADAAEKVEAFVYIPRSGRKDGEPVMLIEAQDGPLWYSSRLVRDEHVRIVRGNSERAGDGKGETPKKEPNDTPKPSPIPPIGEGKGDDIGPCARGRSSSSSSSLSVNNHSVTNVTGAEAPQQMTAKDAIFGFGVPWLVDRGATEKNARSVLGKACNQLGDDEAWSLMRACMSEEPVEAFGWLMKAIAARTNPAKGGNSAGKSSQIIAKGMAAAEEFAAQMAAEHGINSSREPGIFPDDGKTFDME